MTAKEFVEDCVAKCEHSQLVNTIFDLMVERFQSNHMPSDQMYMYCDYYCKLIHDKFGVSPRLSKENW